MKFGASRSQLYDAQKTARARWEIASEAWGDDAKSNHEEKVWLPWDDGTSKVLRAVDQLAVLFVQIRQECEYSDE